MGSRLQPGLGQFPSSPHSKRFLAGLRGLEVGGSAHNHYDLDTINVDVANHVRESTAYAREQLRLCGMIRPVDVIAPGDCLPFADQSFDFMLASHVIEHFFDPISAIVEWVRVSKRYIYLVVPHADRTADRTRASTLVSELMDLHAAPKRDRPSHDCHWSVWRTDEFVTFAESLDFPVSDVCDPDDKVGNGFAVVIGSLETLDRTPWMVKWGYSNVGLTCRPNG